MYGIVSEIYRLWPLFAATLVGSGGALAATEESRPPIRSLRLGSVNVVKIGLDSLLLITGFASMGY